MGGLITKPKSDGGSSYLPSAPAGVDPFGLNQLEGILNLEHRQVNNEAFGKISAVSQLTKQILSLSLANNRITALVFDGEATKPSDSMIMPTAVRQASSENATATQAGNGSDDDEDDMYRSSSVGCPKPSASAIQLRSSTNWPILENLDLSGNNELFNYGGLSTVNATLRSLRLSNNGIFKVPTEVWCLVNLTKLDLSHNRLLVLPPGIALLTKLNYIKLSHNSLASSSTTSCIPEEMKYCSRLRRLDLSHNKLRELPVNFRVDRENAQRRSVTHSNSFMPSGVSPRHATGVGRSPSVGSIQRTLVTGIAPSASAVPKKGDDDSAPPLALTPSVLAAASQPPPPIKYFDPNRVSYIQITLLNLSNNQIDSLSPSIGLLRSLNSLNLGYNKLRSLPTEIALLAELKYLDLRFNQLPSLLTEICQLPRLSKLCLQNNKISALPYEIRRLKKLTHFFISSNQLVDLPDVIAEVRNVRVLKLCNNKLLTIPDSIFRLQKLRLLDLSFNKLTYLSPDVCTMPLIEDLRLWGNKLSDIPSPILYSDVKKIIGYLRATERERSIIANQMRSFVGPRSHSRMASAKTAPVSLNRAQSATRAQSQRFNPLGFYEGDNGGGGDVGHFAPASSRSVGSAPGMLGVNRAISSTLARGSGGNRIGMGGVKSVDSGSDPEEDFENSDDEFTSMFRAVSSRTASFTHIGGNGVGVGNASSRRSVTLGSSKSVTHSLNPTPSPRDHVSTIVQPFQSSTFPTISSIGSATSGINPIPSPKGSGRQQVLLRPIRDDQDDDEDVDLDADIAELDHSMGDLPPNALAPSSDILTDLVRRDWKPLQPDAQPLASSMSSPPADKDQLMAEWDMQSMAIEKQQTGKQQTGRGRVGSKTFL